MLAGPLPMALRDRLQLLIARHFLAYWDERLERGRNGRTEAIRLRAIRERKNVERVIAEYEATDSRIGR
jgi:hypothetical protein